MRRLGSIFMPYAKRQMDRVRKSGKRMVHYTSAENLFNIIDSQTMWLRNTNCMDDYSEVQHGYSLLLQFFQEGTNRTDFCAALDSCHAGLGQGSLALFDQWWLNIRFNTYICSISEHHDKEDMHGRLSMWRAFGQQSQARAAMVMRVPPQGSGEALRLILSPVAYFGYDQVRAQILRVMRNVGSNLKFLQSLPTDTVKTMVFYMLVSAAVSLKHEGFLEEKEWRIIYLPQANHSVLIEKADVVIRGVPQTVYKVPLREDPPNGVVGVGISTLIERIIIGPTVYGVPMYSTFVESLRKEGVANPETRVVVRAFQSDHKEIDQAPQSPSPLLVSSVIEPQS